MDVFDWFPGLIEAIVCIIQQLQIHQVPTGRNRASTSVISHHSQRKPFFFFCSEWFVSALMLLLCRDSINIFCVLDCQNIHFSSLVTIFYMKDFLSCLFINIMHFKTRSSLFLWLNAYNTHLPAFRIFPIACTRLQIFFFVILLIVWQVFFFWIRDASSSSNVCKFSWLAFSGEPLCSRSLT